MYELSNIALICSPMAGAAAVNAGTSLDMICT